VLLLVDVELVVEVVLDEVLVVLLEVEVVELLVEVVEDEVEVVELEVELVVVTVVEVLVEVEVVVVLVLVEVEVVEVRSAPLFSVPKRLETAPIIVENTAFNPSKSCPFLRIKVALRLCTPSNPSIVYGCSFSSI